jgi:hypothetical protein
MRHRLTVLKRALASAGIRRVEVAFLGYGIAEYGVWVAVLVYAFQRGGATASALVAALQLLPAAVVAPLAARLIGTRGAPSVLFGGYLAQAASIAATAGLLASGAPAAFVYAAAVIVTSAVTVTRPAQSALLPALVDTPAQLTATNVLSSWVESLALLAGPAIASVMLALRGPAAALALFAIVVSGSAWLVLPLRALATGGRAGDGDVEDDGVASASSLMEALRAAPGAIPALGMLGAEYAALGALDVLEVVLAASVLGLGASGAGYLGAMFGAGALVGAGAAVALVGRHRLALPLLLSAASWGAAFILIGVWPAVGVAFCLLALAGATRSVLDVGGRTILHRTVPRELHGRVFGVLEGLEMVGLAVGSLAVPVVVGLAGPRAAMVVFGSVLIVVPLLTARTLPAIERAMPALEHELAILRGFPLFAMLGPPVLEDLARAMVRREAPADEVIVREGETGDEFFLLEAGRLNVCIRGSHVRAIGPGDGFGEIALLRDGIRTATITASSPVTLYALQRAHFLEAVTGSVHAHRAVGDLVDQRVSMLPASPGPAESAAPPAASD